MTTEDAFTTLENMDQQKHLCEEVQKLNAHIAFLRSALEFYATSEHYTIPTKTGQWVGDTGSRVQRDHGQRAKIALNTKI